MDPPQPASAVQSTSSSSSGSESTISSGPGHEPEVNSVQEKEVLEIDLCSEENSIVASDSFGSDSDDGDNPESKLVAEIKEVLNKWERKTQKRKTLENTGGCSQERGHHQEPGCSSWSNVQLPSTSASLKAVEGERDELKRKLEMVTAELSRSRMEQAKKIKRSAARQPLVIEVPDFPIEYYDQVHEFSARSGAPMDWHLAFNKYANGKKQREYLEWIQTRTTEFFPKVLDIMTTVWNKTAPVTSQLNSVDLRECRLVSKPWKRSVDKLIQEPAQNSNSQRHLPMLVTKVCSTDYDRLYNLALLTKSSEALTPHPFPSRSLIVSVCAYPHTYPHEDKKDYTMLFNQFIEAVLVKYGKDLHHFGYHGHDTTTKFFDDSTPFTNSWKTLNEWLKKMPNLRSLQITLPLLTTEEVSSKNSKVTTRAVRHFKQLFAFECRHVPSFLINQVLRRNKTIEKLECFQISGSLKWTDTSTQLKNVLEFSMDVSNMSQILTLGKLQWPLRKLTLFSGPTYQEIVDPDVLFATLRSFQKTLQDLTLKLWITCSEKNLRLELPHLKNLNLLLMESENENKIPYDFLLPLNNLEMLKLEFEQEECETDEEVGGLVQVIQLRGYLNRLYESNVWKLFPCLKKVKGSFYKDGSPKKFMYVRDKIAM